MAHLQIEKYLWTILSLEFMCWKIMLLHSCTFFFYWTLLEESIVGHENVRDNCDYNLTVLFFQFFNYTDKIENKKTLKLKSYFIVIFKLSKLHKLEVVPLKE